MLLGIISVVAGLLCMGLVSGVLGGIVTVGGLFLILKSSADKLDEPKSRARETHDSSHTYVLKSSYKKYTRTAP